MEKYSDLFDIFEKFPEHIEKSLFGLHKSKMNESCFLHEAVKHNKIQIVKKLLRYGLDPNLKDEYGMSPLHNASRASDLKIEMIQELLKYDANPNIETYDGFTPLSYVCWSSCDNGKKIEAISLLISYGGKVNHQNFYGYSILLQAACEKVNLEVIAKLLEHGADPRILPDNKTSIVHLLVKTYMDQEYFEKTIEILQSYHELDVNIQDDQGNTPLHIAAGIGNDEIVKTLLKVGAENKIRNKRGQTPFEMSLTPYSLMMLKFLSF